MRCDCQKKKHDDSCPFCKIEELNHDIFVLVLRLMGEDTNTHSPDTLAVLDKWVPIVSDKLEKT